MISPEKNEVCEDEMKSRGLVGVNTTWWRRVQRLHQDDPLQLLGFATSLMPDEVNYIIMSDLFLSQAFPWHANLPMLEVELLLYFAYLSSLQIYLRSPAEQDHDFLLRPPTLKHEKNT